MSIMSSMKNTKLFKGFSVRVMVLLLVAAGSSIALMAGSIFGVGILAFFNQIIGTYHQQTVESSAYLVTSELEQLLHKNLEPAYEGWAGAGLTLSDLARSKVSADAWHWNFADRQLTFLSASGSAMVPLNEAGIPFLQIAGGNFSADVSGEAIALPKLPARVRWTINRQPAGNSAAWLVWAVATDASSSDVWGFRVTQENLRPHLVKMLRRLCHDNHVLISLTDENENLLMAVSYKGLLNRTGPVVAGKKQSFLERKLGQSLEG
ncbi:MAG: hypothetical protein ACOYXC_03805, partial [Candidatus Rifleibacteriota bacterium]